MDEINGYCVDECGLRSEAVCGCLNESVKVSLALYGLFLPYGPYLYPSDLVSILLTLFISQ